MEKNSGAASKFIQLQQLRHDGQPALPTKQQPSAVAISRNIFWESYYFIFLPINYCYVTSANLLRF